MLDFLHCKNNGKSYVLANAPFDDMIYALLAAGGHLSQASNDFFADVVYSSANEDTASEIKALALRPTDTVLCITGSGARPLDLLVANPKEVIAIDFNPAQSCLLELKVAAMQALSYDDYAGFLGLTSDLTYRDRLHILDRLTPRLEPPLQGFCAKKRSAIGRGILYQGRWESYLHGLSFLGALRRPVLQRLFDAPDLLTQTAIWDQHWNGMLWRGTIRALSSRWLWRDVIKEPGMAFISTDFDVARYMLARFNHVARHVRFSDSPFVHLFLLGKFNPQKTLPIHLAQENFSLIKSRLDRLRIVTGSLTSFLKREENKATIDGFSLSDFSSYCGLEDYSDTWTSVQAAARPGARVSERQFLVHRDPTDIHGLRLRRDPGLEEHLNHSDSSFIYQHVCGVVS